MSLLVAVTLSGLAQTKSKKSAQTVFEQSQTRYIEPEVRVFITPMVADIQMVSSERRYYVYEFPLCKPYTELTFSLIEEFKKTALFYANKEESSDLMVGALFNVKVLDNDKSKLIVEVSGFPATYTNWHMINFNDTQQLDRDLKMIETIYGNSYWIDRSLRVRSEDAAVK